MFPDDWKILEKDTKLQTNQTDKKTMRLLRSAEHGSEKSFTCTWCRVEYSSEGVNLGSKNVKNEIPTKPILHVLKKNRFIFHIILHNYGFLYRGVRLTMFSMHLNHFLSILVIGLECVNSLYIWSSKCQRFLFRLLYIRTISPRSKWLDLETSFYSMEKISAILFQFMVH